MRFSFLAMKFLFSRIFLSKLLRLSHKTHDVEVKFKLLVLLLTAPDMKALCLREGKLSEFN